MAMGISPVSLYLVVSNIFMEHSQKGPLYTAQYKPAT
jgi:hypothetical protein